MKQFNVEVTPTLKRLELISKKRLVGFLTGEFRSVLRGRGLEFHGYRQYHPAEDDAKNIDWKASLRSRYLVVKELIEERNNNVIFMIDTGSTMSFGSEPKLKNEYAIELFASLAHSLLGEGDSVGLCLFNNSVKRLVRPNIGNKQFYMMLQELQKIENYEGITNFDEGFKQLDAMNPRKSIIIVISDFLNTEGWDERLKLMAEKHELIFIAVNDKRDFELPPEVRDIMVQDPYTGQELLINTKEIAEDYARITKDYKDRLQKLFKNSAIDVLWLTTDQPFAKQIYLFFKKRAAT